MLHDEANRDPPTMCSRFATVLPARQPVGLSVSGRVGYGTGMLVQLLQLGNGCIQRRIDTALHGPKTLLQDAVAEIQASLRAAKGS